MTDFGQRRRQLLKTGQKDLFHIGDDGDLEMGLARSYTILTTGQHAGTTDITINAKTHSLSNNVVNDNSTGLMWARYVPDGDIGPDNNGTLYWEDDTNSEDIWEFVARANANALGGYTDWRVANAVELDSLVIHDAGITPRIDGTAFPSTPSAYMFVSTTRTDNTLYAGKVSFNTAARYVGYKTTEKNYCRLVRGGT